MDCSERRGLSPLAGTVLMIVLTLVLVTVFAVAMQGFTLDPRPPPGHRGRDY